MKKNIIIIVLAVVAAAAVAISWTQKQTLDQRQQEIHERGTLVMPFDLDKTTHVFNQTDAGGIQQVRAKDPNDTEQIQLIQQHLRAEADRFSQGDFGDPQTLHGESMPGLDVLTTQADELEVEYKELEDGAQISYLSDNPEVLNAIHLWFMAQLTDHGTDAQPHLAQ
ncbi:MAG: aspartate carbamoyltransferase [Candidatus Buchananbacteria bacterium CG10_big_fil_rev_8_21_14_0_10_42_9]|uniref:Aspartate carbamoyltransferase n=1 Tax=Candidatus Buchananbacteria bacterium CG10_big_fil_rev_8_21_14_0_10_42_9 TaxID=1974526 RepID=A0A2H0W190_9BACT|nr:MAG: aspartate carbamoyltransferase [Candidatus Buchananbacteria bacterium CG10_big_fil_rev_8_21_14_0_10_42_9]